METRATMKAEDSLFESLDRRSKKKESQAQKAYNLLEEMMVTLQLPPGSVLSEESLSQHLEIGRAPIREALRQLALEGLVNILPRRGTLVSDVDVKRQLKLIELRRELERLMARNSARLSTEGERQSFREISEGMRGASASNDDREFMRLDSQLNQLLNSASRNEFVTKAMSLLQGLSRRFWYLHYKEVGDLPLCARLHADLAGAIADGDENAAEKASALLMDYVEDFARAALDAE